MSTLSHARRRSLGAVCAVAATLLIVAGCSSSSTPTETVADQVTISNHMFQTPASVKAGATITVRNDDSDEHTVTATAGGFDTEVQGKQTVTFTAPTSPGSYDFYCKYHPSMKATLVVS
ncbi:plastocyanin [Nocardia sp. SYP-A9097]|uniref:cupredoxin domain-containing protein n=1 Tax=Nocardia sp. SYP-A9097 TaxID=2663237 RepID=UPI00129BC6A5|nr:cupredoxin domain-containing protein [Nocardia sp. SYP-A9097]MRH89484.1 plastocyanin [Nocardia sp. SYP-A9097]